MANEVGWYYFIGGQQFGPVTEAELKQLAQNKIIKPDDETDTFSLSPNSLGADSYAMLPGGSYKAQPTPDAFWGWIAFFLYIVTIAIFISLVLYIGIYTFAFFTFFLCSGIIF